MYLSSKYKSIFVVDNVSNLTRNITRDCVYAATTLSTPGGFPALFASLMLTAPYLSKNLDFQPGTAVAAVLNIDDPVANVAFLGNSGQLRGRMVDELLCKNIRKLLSRLLRVAFGKDFEAMLASRGHELWVLGLDAEAKQFIDICGNISLADLKTIQDRGFFDTDAGYQVSAHAKLGISTPFDAFLLNTAHYGLRKETVDPLVIHELSHLMEQTNVPPVLEANDAENAEAILKSLKKNVRDIHTMVWAQHLAIGARVMIQKKLTPHVSIRSFLEAANPWYDRETDIRAKKGW
jgi:hypothetical protein